MAFLGCATYGEGVVYFFSKLYFEIKKRFYYKLHQDIANFLLKKNVSYKQKIRLESSDIIMIYHPLIRIAKLLLKTTITPHSLRANILIPTFLSSSNSVSAVLTLPPTKT